MKVGNLMQVTPLLTRFWIYGL